MINWLWIDDRLFLDRTTPIEKNKKWLLIGLLSQQQKSIIFE